jgi:hypothetical protein
MKAFPALLQAVVGLFSLSVSTPASAQLFHIVSKDSLNPWGTTDSWNNSGVAVNAKFEFSVSPTVGTLKLTLTNLAGTAKSIWGEGAGNYTSGILTQFAFDIPSNLKLISGSTRFTEALAPGNGGETGGIDFELDVPQTIGAWSYDFGADSVSEAKGLAGGFSAIFTFKFTGTTTANTPAALANFNTGNFFKTNGSASNDPDMGFRFENVGPGCDDDFDKFAYWVNDNPPIPEPSTYGLMGAGALVGAIIVKRRRAARSF